LLGNTGHRRLSHEHRGIRVDEWSVSGAAAPASGDLRDAPGQRTNYSAWFRALELFSTNRRANLFQTKLIRGRSGTGLAGHPCAHTIGGFVKGGKRNGTKKEGNTGGGERVR